MLLIESDCDPVSLSSEGWVPLHYGVNCTKKGHDVDVHIVDFHVLFESSP